MHSRKVRGANNWKISSENSMLNQRQNKAFQKDLSPASGPVLIQYLSITTKLILLEMPSLSHELS